LAQVTVRINGYAYTVGCEDGQEAHLTRMAEQVEGRIESIKAMAGQSGEAKLLVLAALLMADELHDLKTAMAAIPRPAGAPPLPSGPDPALTRTLGRLATRAEEIAAALERP
jgi:cell division protein ZapA